MDEITNQIKKNVDILKKLSKSMTDLERAVYNLKASLDRLNKSIKEQKGEENNEGY